MTCLPTLDTSDIHETKGIQMSADERLTTPVRNVRITDKLWDKTRELATARGIVSSNGQANMSLFVRNVLTQEINSAVRAKELEK